MTAPIPVQPGPPLWLLAELTYRCPLHCVFCYNPVDFAHTPDELSTDDWLRVLREARAAARIFGLLPEDQAAEFRALWDEFEAKQTAEAKFAAAVDRLQPMLLNARTQGHAWREHGVTFPKVMARNQQIGEGSTALWHYTTAMIEAAVRAGHLAR